MAQSANLLQTFQTIVNRAGCAAGGRRAGQGQHRQAAEGRRTVRPPERDRRRRQKLLSDVRNGKGTISKLIYDDALYQEIRSPIKRVDALLADLQAGKGSAGKLLKDPGAV